MITSESLIHALSAPQAELKEKEVLIGKMKKEIEEMQAQEAREEGKLMDVRHELEKYVAKMKENQQKINHFKNEVIIKTTTLEMR